jgi:hypothetical protein
LYGNWMRPKALSIRGVGWRTAIAVAAAYLVALYVMQSDPGLGAAILGTALLVTAASAGRVGGLPLTAWAGSRARWLVARRTGRTTFRAIGPTGWRLPEPLHRTRMLTVGSGPHGYGAVLDPDTRRVAVTLRVASTAADLIDGAEHDAAVGRWERWLEALGRRPEVAWVNVTVETSPSPGTQLRDMVSRRLTPSAPQDCRALMDALVDASPGVAARTDTRVTIVFDLRAWDVQVGRAGRRAGITAYLPLLDHAVSGLHATLDGCGVTVIGRATAEQLAGAVRVAFDPGHAGDVELALSHGGLAELGPARRELPQWEFAGPAASQEYRDAYVADTGTSVSFVWAQAPRQLVASTVLDALARPGRRRKRFTCTYVPTAATQAMDAATAQVRWRWLARMVAALPVVGHPTTAQDDRDAAAAEQATREVAAGAGWVAQTLTCTVTVLDDADLPAAVAEVEHAAGVSQLRLRRLTELQAAGFLAGLPAGISLTELAQRWTR